MAESMTDYGVPPECVPRILRALDDCKRHGHCCLCGAPVDRSAVFIPHDSRRFGAAPHKDRVIIYGLCGQCLNQDDVLSMVETKMELETTRHRYN